MDPMGMEVAISFDGHVFVVLCWAVQAFKSSRA